MTEWLYLASHNSARASLQDTLAAAMGRNVIWRGSRKDNGALIPNAQHLRPGDTLILGFRRPVMRAYLRARVGVPRTPAAGTTAIDVVGAPYAHELQSAGYPIANGITEVIHLEDLEECCFDLVGTYVPNQQALWRMDHEPRDAAAARHGNELQGGQTMQSAGSGERTARMPVKVAKHPSPVLTATRVVPHATSGARCFDGYVMIDWSASRSPAVAEAPDSIWSATGEWCDDRFHIGPPLHHPTRFGARTWLESQLAKWAREKRRILVGCDFAFGYPKGFAAALGATNGSWKDVHRLFLNVPDDSRNMHGGACFAASCNDVVAPRGPGPFWGCHLSDIVPGRLTQRRVGVFSFPYGNARLDEWLITDCRARQIAVPQSVWKLNCGVSVGMQTIVGIKHLAELRRTLDGMARIWPFETGFKAPAEPEVWLAEIFPSIVITDTSIAGEEPRDKRQVVSCVLEAAFRDATGSMRATLGRPAGLLQPQVDAVLHEEGWMLFL